MSCGPPLINVEALLAEPGAVGAVMLDEGNGFVFPPPELCATWEEATWRVEYPDADQPRLGWFAVLSVARAAIPSGTGTCVGGRLPLPEDAGLDGSRHAGGMTVRGWPVDLVRADSVRRKRMTTDAAVDWLLSALATARLWRWVGAVLVAAGAVDAVLFARVHRDLLPQVAVPLAALSIAPLLFVRWRPFEGLGIVVVANGVFVVCSRMPWPPVAVVGWLVALIGCPLVLSRPRSLGPAGGIGARCAGRGMRAGIVERQAVGCTDHRGVGRVVGLGHGRHVSFSPRG